MGTAQQLTQNTDCDRINDFLDHNFPLEQGSHSTATSYLVYFGHLLVIHGCGKATGLRTPSQFIEANGNLEAPQSISLESHGLQVELEPAKRCTNQSEPQLQHRIQLQTQFELH